MKHLAKKSLLIFLAFTLIFVLAACGSNNNESNGNTNGEEQEPVTLKVLTHYVAANEEKFQPYIDRWNSENPLIQIELEAVDFGELLSGIRAKQTSGQIADIMHVYSVWNGQLNESNVFAAAPDDVVSDIKANYPAGAISGVTTGDTIYGYPTEVQTYGLYYNKKLLQDAGFTNPPATWDELFDMAQKLTKKDSSGKITQMGFSFMRGYPSLVVHPFMALMNTTGTQLLSDDMTKSNLNSEAGIKTMKLAASFYENKIADIAMDPVAAFAGQQSAMSMQASWYAGALRTAFGDDAANVGAAPIPVAPGGEQSTVAYTWMWGVNQNSKNQAQAWEFLKWFNSVALEDKDGLTSQGSFLLDLNTVSTRASDLATSVLQEKINNDEVLKMFVDSVNYAKAEPNPRAANEIQSVLSKHIESVHSGQATAEQAVQNAHEEIEALLQ